jgi:hypothetical protein
VLGLDRQDELVERIGSPRSRELAEVPLEAPGDRSDATATDRHGAAGA